MIEWKRLLLHIPWGLLAALIYFLVSEPSGIVAVFLAITYEVVQDWRKEDHSYHDILGIVWGFLVGMVFIIIIKLLGIYPEALL